MGQTLTKLWTTWTKRRLESKRILMVGLDAGGKTTILYKLKYALPLLPAACCLLLLLLLLLLTTLQFCHSAVPPLPCAGLAIS